MTRGTAKSNALYRGVEGHRPCGLGRRRAADYTSATEILTGRQTRSRPRFRQVLAPWPNRIRDGQYTFEGTAYQLALTEPARHNAIHGLANWTRWRLAEQSPDSVTVEYDLPAQEGYPWSLLLRTRWSVSADGLRCDQEVTNTGGENAPWGYSVHPYVQLTGVAVDDILLRVPGRTRVLADSRLLPWRGQGAVRIRLPDPADRAAGLDTTFGDIDATPRRFRGHHREPGRDAHSRGWGDEGIQWWQVSTPTPRYEGTVPARCERPMT